MRDQKGGAGWEGPRAGGRGSRPVTRGPESRQGRRGEEKVGDAATVHGGAGPAETPGQTCRDRQAGTGWGGWERRQSAGTGAAQGLPPLPRLCPA